MSLTHRHHLANTVRCSLNNDFHLTSRMTKYDSKASILCKFVPSPQNNIMHILL